MGKGIGAHRRRHDFQGNRFWEGQGVTGNAGRLLDFKIRSIAPGLPATMVLVKGRPDRDIADSVKIVQIWMAGRCWKESKEVSANYRNRFANPVIKRKL